MKKLGYVNKRNGTNYLIEQKGDQYYATPVKVVYEVEEKWIKKDPNDKYTSYILTNEKEVKASAKEVKVKDRIPLEFNLDSYGYFFETKYKERIFKSIFSDVSKLEKKCYRREIYTEMLPAYGCPI